MKYKIKVVVSAYSGIMCCEKFSEMHEFVEHLLGHPVWTHEFVDKKLMRKIKCLIKEQTGDLFNEITEENVLKWSKTQEGLIEISKGSEERTEDPITSCERIMSEVKNKK